MWSWKNWEPFGFSNVRFWNRLNGLSGAAVPPTFLDVAPGVSAAYLQTISAALSETRAAAAAAAGAAAAPAAPPAFPVRIAYTALHGVGTPLLLRAFAAFGLPPPSLVSAQCAPDAAFPTLPFPNSEERGALELGCAAAAAAGCTLLLANDPDADRLGAAEWDARAGAWRPFTGNEIGTLLAAWLLRRPPPPGAPQRILVGSAVSSRAVAALAAARGAPYVETLTGFKHMGAVMAAAPANGHRVAFAFEEALGYACCDAVRDKDGISAAAVLAEAAHAAARRGATLRGELDALAAQHGLFLTAAGYLRAPGDGAATAAIFARLRNGGRYWLRLGGGLNIAAIRDLAAGDAGFDSEAPGGRPALPHSPGNMLTYKLSNTAVVTLRTSGTEPKIKYYAEREAAAACCCCAASA